jgi:hypothetical protein
LICSVYTCQNSLLGNYSEENGIPILSQSNMASSIHSMSLDLYGLSITPPSGGCTSSPPPRSSTQVPSDLISPIDTIPSSSSLNKQEENSRVIYPWMRKVHINNPG